MVWKGFSAGDRPMKAGPPHLQLLPCTHCAPPRVCNKREGQAGAWFHRVDAERLHRLLKAGHPTAILLFTLAVEYTPPGKLHDKAF